MLACPTLAKEEPTIILNGLHYIAKDPVYIEENILYLSPEDLKNLTYGELIQAKKGVELKIQNNTFELNPNDCFVKIDANALWTTYSSDTRLNQLDITKTIDATLMQSLYTYYRDYLDLRDDLFTSPIQFIQKGSSDQLLHTVYWDNISGQNTNYEVIIYKNIESDFITYYVDLRLKKSNA